MECKLKKIFRSLISVISIFLLLGLFQNCSGSFEAGIFEPTSTVSQSESSSFVSPAQPPASSETTTPTSSPAMPPGNQIQLIGNKIYDKNGKQIIARGPECVVASGIYLDSLDQIAATGANAIRILMTLDRINGMTPEIFDAILAKAVSYNLLIWVSLYTWDSGNNHVIGESLGGGNFYSLQAPDGVGSCSESNPRACYLAVWNRPWIKNLMEKYRSNVIIDAMQEYIAPPGVDAGSAIGRRSWANDAKTNIQFFRRIGYTQPLEIMTNFQGRDLSAILEHGTEIRSVDTVKINNDPQTLFGWQAYWSASGAPSFYPDWQGELIYGQPRRLTAAEAILDILPRQTFPIQVGLDNYPDDTNTDYALQMEQAAKVGIGWLWWAWSEGRGSVDCPVSGSACVDHVTNSDDGFAGAKPLSRQ